MNSFDAFIDAGWSEHAEQPQAVADRLLAASALPASPEQASSFGYLAAHVFGEHLGQWQRGIELLETLRASSAASGSEPAQQSLGRAIATLRYAGGDASALDGASPEDRVSGLAAAASALAGRGQFEAAMAAFSTALREIPAGLPDASRAVRGLAVGGNNLAAALEEKASRSAAESAAMLVAARAGLEYWKRAGTWREEAWAHHRLASSLLQAGDAGAAQQSARACLDVCEAQDPVPAFERFFALSMLARAYRAAGDSGAFVAIRERARAEVLVTPEAERSACSEELALLEDRESPGHRPAASSA